MASCKYWYVVVMDKYKTIYQKQCADVKEANDLLKELKEKYPKPYYTTKEWF